MRAVLQRPTLLAVLVLAVVLQGAPATAVPVRPAAPAALPAGGLPPLAYLSLGDSLAAGVQADENGDSVLTRSGYADQLFDRFAKVVPGLRHVRLGCPGETTETMLRGGICPYADGSQLDQAVAVLRAASPRVLVVTIDIGANDVNACLSGGVIDESCVTEAFTRAARNLGEILARLRAAARPLVPIVGMSYYNPYLAAWLQGPQGRALARATTDNLIRYNDTLERVYAAARVPVADVESAFATTRLDDTVELPVVGPVPVAVARVCQLTWMCVLPPRRPNIHANTHGYRVIARAYERALLASLLRGGLKELAERVRAG